MNGNSLVKCSIFTTEMVKIIDSEVLEKGDVVAVIYVLDFKSQFIDYIPHFTVLEIRIQKKALNKNPMFEDRRIGFPSFLLCISRQNIEK